MVGEWLAEFENRQVSAHGVSQRRACDEVPGRIMILRTSGKILPYDFSSINFTKPRGRGDVVVCSQQAALGVQAKGRAEFGSDLETRFDPRGETRDKTATDSKMRVKVSVQLA